MPGPLAEICPTIDAADSESFRAQIEQVAGFARRIHIDVADGSMTPNKLVGLDQVWWPGGLRADIHLMYKWPAAHLEALVALAPQLVIFHAEAEGDFRTCADALHRHGIETGVALLPQTPVLSVQGGLDQIDHVLIFSGNLGHFGGTADLALLDKVKQLKALKPSLEIGWDGGVDGQNAARLATGGVQVLNSGGFIQKAADPAAAYATLEAIIARH